MKRIQCIGVLLLSALHLAAYDVKVDDIHFNLDKENMTATVVGCGWGVSGISIPESIEVKEKEYIVNCIADSAFMSNGSLGSVDIPNTITKIGKAAFRGCSRISSVDIPASVKIIGEQAFTSCGNLYEFRVDPKNPSYSDEEGILYNKNKTQLIQCPIPTEGEVTAHWNVTEVCAYAFYKCTKIYSVILPNNVKSIGEHAFDRNDDLHKVIIGSGLKQIGSYAFDNCKNIKNFYCQATVPPSAKEDTFDLEWSSYIKLHVPKASIQQYKDAKPWKWLDEIVALTESEIEAGIKEINKQTSGETYTLDGKKATKLTKGLLIIKGTNRKILKK